MAVKFRLSDEEKEKANKLLNVMDSMSGSEEDISNRRKEEQERANKLFNKINEQKTREEIEDNEIKKQVNSINLNFAKNNPQTVSLPTASNNSRYTYRNIQNNNILPTKENSEKINNNNIKVSSKPIKDISGVFKSSNAFDDGYQPGDINKTALSSVADLGANIVKGMTNLTESTGDLISYGIAQIAENIGHKDYADRLRKVTARNQFDDNLFNPINNKIDGNSVFGNKTDNVAQGVGQVATTTALAMAGQTGAGALGLGATGTKALTSIPSTLSTFTSGMGNGMTEAYNEGATDDEAWKYGFISGMAEAGTEAMFGGLGKMTGALGLGSGLSSLDDTVAKKVASVFKSRLAKNLSEYTIKAGAEGLEEVASGFIQAIGQKLTYKSEEDLRKLISDQNLLEQFIDASIVSAIAQTPGPSGIIQTTRQNRDFISGLTPGQEIINNDKIQQKLQEAQDIIDNVNNQADNLTNLQTQQTIQQENKTAQNQTSGQLNDILNNKELPMQSYQYEKSDNVKINNLRQDANKYFNNSEEARNYVNMLEKIITDKNIEIRLDANLKTADGRMANGSYSNGVITINPNSTRTGEFIAIHELTHAIGTDSMKNIVETYRKSNKEFDTAVEKLLQNYKSTEITEEALSDISAQLFGNQEFINNIAQNNPNIFQKLYSEIKYLWHQFRGYKNQNQFVEDLYYKWTQAYNNNNQLNNTTNYYIETVADFNEMEYNNSKEIRLPKQEYAILSGIVNSDSNIKPGINYVETTNATYEVYYKETGEFKVLGKEVSEDYYDTITNGNIQGTGITRDAESGMQVYSPTVQQSRTGTRNDEISDFNKRRTRISDTSIKNGSSNSINVKYSIQESENNSGSFKLKEKQLDIISKNNPMQDDYHTGIRSIEDIKTLEEALQDSDWIDYDEFNPDYTRSMAEEAIQTGKITVYSSYPIKQGTFISPSYMEAESYSGDGKVYSKEVNIKDIAWIDPTQGQYARVNNKYSIGSNNSWQSYLDKNYKATGTRTNLQDIKLPTAQKQVAPTAENNVLPTVEKYRTEEQIAKDKTISDLDAIKEASEQVNTPSLKSTEQRENQLKEKGLDKSPTIDYIKKKRSKEKVTVKEIKDTLAQKFVNKGHYIDKLANKTGNKKLTYLYDRTMNTFNEAQISIGDYQINSKGEIVGKSIIDIFQPSVNAGLELEFEDYLLNKHNISRYTYEKGLYGKEISAMDSAEIVLKYEEKYPEFKEWAKEVNSYNDNNLKDLVANGMINQSTYNKLKEMYGNYVPTYRDIVEDMSNYEDNSVGNNPIKRATQSDKDILSVKESMAEQTLMQKKAIRMNNLGLELYKTIGKNNTILEGIEVDPLAIQTITGDVIEKATDGSNVFTIFKDGEMIQFKISDELYTAFSKDTLQNKINNNKVAKAVLTPVEKLTKAQRELLTTYSIGFALNNPIKDIQDAVFNSKYNGLTFAKNYVKALYNIGTNGSWYQSYKNNGGTANTYFDYNKGILPTETKNPVKKFANAIKKANNVIEQAPRLAEYISTIEHKGTIDEALYNAAEVTTNFKRGGDITKAVNKYGFNFINASIQGLDKVYRNITGQNGIKGYTNLLVKATLYQIAPAILNGLLLKDDDDYGNLPEYIKDNYFLIKMEKVASILPTAVKDELLIDGKFFRIPKGRVSAVIGGIARRALETAEGKDVDWKSVVDTAIDQLAPNSLKNSFVGAPIIQAVKNEAWYGGDIVSSRLQKLPTAEQYDESTDEFSKWLGEKLNISPKKINYVIDQYSGGIGDVLLPILTPQAENNILEDKFTTDAVMKNKNVSKYYSQLEELEKKNNSINATDEEKLKYKYFSNTLSDISDLYKKKREVQSSDLSDKEKRKQVKELQKQINAIVEEKLNTVENIKINGNIATIGNSKYYKTTNVKDGTQSWKELSEEEKKKNKNISLTTYANYKEKIAQETIKQRKSGDIKEDESLKNKDKILILTNSSYSDKEKQSLYENYIKETTDKKYEIVKSVENFNINSYLEYKLADSNEQFKADRKDDGTESGSAIRSGEGSSKEKRYNYILSMKNTSYMQKVILFGLETTPSKSDKATIVNYIISMQDKNNTEKKEMLKQFSWITWYKDGTFDY